ncbi:metallophosphatase, partial [Streptococcus suis]
DELIIRFDDYAQVPIVSSNLLYQYVDVADYLVPLEDVIEFDMNGKNLYVLGLTTLETQEVASPSENLSFEDHKQALRRL